MNCCRQLAFADSVAWQHDSIIANQLQMLRAADTVYNLKFADWHLADSLYKATTAGLNECNYDVQRLKKGKRNWIIVSLFTTAGLAFMIFK